MPATSPSIVPLAGAESGSGPVLMLLHDLGSNRSFWRWQASGGLSNLRVITVDLAGHGESPPPPDPAYAPQDHARDVLNFMDAKGIRGAWVLGLALGGFVALSLALNSPQRILGQILVGTASHCDKFTRGVYQEWLRIAEEEGTEAFLDRQLKDVFHPDFLLENLDDLLQFRDAQAGTDPRPVRPSLVGAASFDARPSLHRVTVPTLVIHGMEDRVFDTTHARVTRQSIAGSQMKLYPFGGHMVSAERAAEFNELVQAYILEGRKPDADPAHPLST